MSGTIEVPLSVVVDVWRLLSSLGVSLADLGRWESEPRIDERFNAEVYGEFLTDFDVTRKLLKARRLLSSILEQRFGVNEVDALAEPIEYWEWQPGKK
jgi:hypothetical protein